jgi:hypothetical protein
MRITGLIISIFITSVLFGQNEISGKIFDFNTGEPIADALIIEYTTVFGASSDSAGYFKYRSKKKKIILLVSHVNYLTKRIEVNTKKTKHLDIGLESTRYELGGITLKPDFLTSILEFQCEKGFSEPLSPDSLFIIVESAAEYPGGIQCIDKHFAEIFLEPIKNEQLYPFGVLQIFFDINEHGFPTNIQIDKEVQKETLDLIEQTFMTMKKWKPAEQRGCKILTRFTYRLMLEN